MKAKYYMRGIGLGMMLIAGGMLAAGIPSDKERLSKEEIVEAAKQYGLEVTEDHLDLEGIVGSSDKEEKEQEETLLEENESDSEPDFIEEPSDMEADLNKDTEEETTETQTSAENEITTEGDTLSNEDDAISENVREYAIVEVTSGMYGVQFARAAYQAGLISDEEDFKEYMAVNRYANKMHTGVYQIEIGSTYEEICKIITTPGR